MSLEGNRVVWILGSGFSRHVGGPLLDELLSPKMGAIVTARYGDAIEQHQEVRSLFAAHHEQGHRLWDNAEQFLDMLDQARNDKGLAKLLMPVPYQSGIDALANTATHAVADECRFCDVAFTEGEAWRPYKRWAKSMGALDHVITFNYDSVLESLDRRAPLPHEEVQPRDVFKLHGSVDWIRQSDGKLTRGLKRGNGFPFIATPGPTKLAHTDGEGLLKPLWEHAHDVLVTANAIVFMGYRFPPTDSHALSKILDGIFENTTDVLRLHTVLGPRVNDDDTVRLKMLLLRTVRAANRKPRSMAGDRPAYSVQVHPLYAQDFMATFTENELLRPPPVDDLE